MLLLEAVPVEVSQQVVQSLAKRSDAAALTPVIGCGAGPACHGHVIVLHDLLGLSNLQPPFAPPLAHTGQHISDTAARWKKIVESGEYLRENHPYRMS
jgi:3-methyl-2-oxobutanoate hydroxymethyltransferase